MRWIAALAAALVLGGKTQLTQADPDSTPQPTSRPLFEELNRETQSLFRQVAPSIARVQMPMEYTLIIPNGDFFNKYRLDPDAQRKLMDMQQRGGEVFVHTQIVPATMPSGGANNGHLYVVQAPWFSPNNMGIVIDDHRHLLVPHFVSKEAFLGAVPVVLADGHFGTAKFVASDHPADVTILELQEWDGAPVQLGDKRPEPGALQLLLSLNPASNRLVVWEGREPDVTTVIDVDGRVSGFTKAGRFFPAGPYAAVASDLIQYGKVRRPFLGVSINTVFQDDPQRHDDLTLGTAPAMRVFQVVQGSAADKAGLQPNDLILRLGHQPVGDEPTFAAALANHRGNTEMTIYRDHHAMTVTVDLEVPQ